MQLGQEHRQHRALGGTNWAAVEVFLVYESEELKTVTEWIALATEVRALAGEREPIPARLAGKGQS